MGQTTGELKDELQRHRVEVSADLEAIGDRVSPGRMAERRRAQVRNRFASVKERVMGTANDLTSKVNQEMGSVAGTAADAPAVARRQVQGNPMAAGVVAFAAGVLVASMLPESQAEQHLAEQVQPGLEHVAQESREAAGQMAEHLQPAAQDATREVADHARQSAEQMKEHATSGTGD